MRTSCYWFLIGALGLDPSFSRDDGVLCVLAFVGSSEVAWRWSKSLMCAVLLFIVSLDGNSPCNCLAPPSSVSLWSSIGCRALSLCLIVSKRVFEVSWVWILKKTACLQVLSRKDGERRAKFRNLILESISSVALQWTVCCVVCCKSRAASSYKICAFTADFDGGFVNNHERAAAKTKATYVRQHMGDALPIAQRSSRLTEALCLKKFLESTKRWRSAAPNFRGRWFK